MTYQDSLYNLLAPSFNLTSCRIDSTGIYGELKLMVVRLALDTIHNTLFMVLVPGYSIEPQHILDHIWQSYANPDGKTVELSTQVYYTNFMNAIRPFNNLKEYPINLARVFQDHMNPSMQKSFRTHYPTFGATRLGNAITQHSILMDMLTALIKAKNDNLTNICNIVCVEQCGREQFHASKICPTMPSVAEQTLRRYADDSTKISHNSRGSNRNNCFGCGERHPWSKLVNRKHVVICPNANKPGMREKAEVAISKYQLCRRRNAKYNKKHKNLNTVNWEDIPEK
jgi:hypothetical protein